MEIKAPMKKINILHLIIPKYLTFCILYSMEN